MNSVLFRLDGNRKIGMGHISRCTGLATYLKKYEISSHFLLKKNNSATKLIHESGFSYTAIPRNANENTELSTIIHLHKKINFEYIVIDLVKNKNTQFFSKLGKLCKIIVLDNIHKSSFKADLVIWPWSKPELKKKFYLKMRNKLLSGPEYMLISNTENIKYNKRRSNSILVSLGGSDKLNYTEKIISEFKKSNFKFHLYVVVGPFFKNKNKIMKCIKNDNRFHIIKNKRSLIPLMLKSKVGIFSFGITAYESLFAKLPSLMFSHSKINDLYARKLASYGCISYLGYYKTMKLREIPKQAYLLMNDSKLRKKYSDMGRKIVDGRGMERVSKIILESLH